MHFYKPRPLALYLSAYTPGLWDSTNSPNTVTCFLAPDDLGIAGTTVEITHDGYLVRNPYTSSFFYFDELEEMLNLINDLD